VVAPRGTVVPRRLGRAAEDPYEHPRGCADRGRVFAASEFTRPQGKGMRNGLPLGEGFFLSFPRGFEAGTTTTSAIPGIYTGSPVYYQYAPRHFVTYFFFYAFSRALRIGNHQGDWERISVCLDGRERATGVIYYQHQSRAPIPWTAVGKLGNHPIVYSARESHASYLTAGFKRFPNDDREEGLIWPTWRELINVFDQPWYGFGGAWGKARGQSDFTGPLGPSQHGDKAGAPCATTVEER
jgi:hypothetical protein